jgi:hypothetical protein
MTAWPSIPAAAKSSIASLLVLKYKGSVTLVSAVGKPSGRRLRRRRLSLPREKELRAPLTRHVATFRQYDGKITRILKEI